VQREQRDGSNPDLVGRRLRELHRDRLRFDLSFGERRLRERQPELPDLAGECDGRHGELDGWRLRELHRDGL
jgi:hypothetical protein